MWEDGSASDIWGLDVVVSVIGLRLCVVGDGFRALHWNMLSWLEFACWAWALRVLRRRWVVRGVSGGWMFGLARAGIAWFMCGG